MQSYDLENYSGNLYIHHLLSKLSILSDWAEIQWTFTLYRYEFLKDRVFR